MAYKITTRVVLAFFCTLISALQVAAQTGAAASLTTPPPTSFSNATRTSAVTNAPGAGTATAPDVYLNVPTLSVGRIELDVDDLSADINLNAKVANLVTLNAGVKVSITKVNITIADIDAQLELVVRLGHLVDIVNRVFKSLDLNPLIINTLNSVTGLADSVVGDVVGAVDGLLGSITQGGSTLNFLVDNLGNIVQDVSGGASQIVGNYLQNMTETGTAQSVGNGLTQKTYSYSPLNSLVDIIFNTAGQVVQATVQKKSGSSSSASGSATASSVASSTAAAANSTSA